MAEFSVPTEIVEYILLGTTHDKRQLQDSPVLGDVWLAYAGKPASVQDLLVSPHWDTTAANVAANISESFKAIYPSDQRKRQTTGPGVAYLQGIVATKLSFEALLLILVPMTLWWHDHDVWQKLGADDYAPKKLRDWLKQIYSPRQFSLARSQGGLEAPSLQDRFSALDRYIALAALLLWAGTQPDPGDGDEIPSGEEFLQGAVDHIDEIVEALVGLYSRLEDSKGSNPPAKRIFQISLNRRTWAALEKSIPAVKADAARTLFQVNCNKIAWAILDSGVYGEHNALQRGAGSCVVQTLDFTRTRDIISSDAADMDDDELALLLDGSGLKKRHARSILKLIAEDAAARRPVNWSAVEQLITLKTPPRPTVAHGTHVAGILAANEDGNSGMCPGIELYDCRVLAKSLKDTEFAIIAALQYIRYVNEQHNFITIHGANLSLSIPHSVRNYACGHTPVCIECERLVNSGVVIVAAAGNRGYHKFETTEGIYEGYAAFSITDPGNADSVITVGSTHGNWPHTYGVSFFSSRGPTGDGRVKPDLVAPGERIRSTVLDNEWAYESGTSMAAPHVSGAAAMLMARYPELVGQPRRIKQILCDTATDLSRDPSFQGRGMLDVLRAFQSI